jgi:hypothetical protein
MSTTDAIVRFFHAIDDRDWAAVRSGLTDELVTDYSSLFGGGPERVTADALVEQWQGFLPKFDGTQHFIGPIVITGDVADCNVRGYHRHGGQTWMVAGRYRLTLAGSRVAGIVLRTTYEEGERLPDA